MTQRARKELEQARMRDIRNRVRTISYPKCQKCLEQGHWTYQCNGKRKFVSRLTRAALLRKKLRAQEAASQGRLWELIRTKSIRGRRSRSPHSSSDSMSSSVISDSDTQLSLSSDSSSSSTSSKESSCDSDSSSIKGFSDSEPEQEVEVEQEDRLRPDSNVMNNFNGDVNDKKNINQLNIDKLDMNQRRF